MRTLHLGLLTWRCLNEIMTMMYFSVLQFTQCILFLFLIFIGFRYNLGKFKAPSLCVYCPGIIAMAHLSVFVISYWVFVCFFCFLNDTWITCAVISICDLSGFLLLESPDGITVGDSLCAEL